MSKIAAVAPAKASGDDPKYIEALWEAFMENYHAFKTGKMKLEDEVKYNLFSAPGPRQYDAYSKFFAFFKDEEKQFIDIWNENKNYMYTHDFFELGDKGEPAILELLEKLNSSKNILDKKRPITMVSGSFWKRHSNTRRKIISFFKKLHENKIRLRIFTCAKKEEDDIRELASLLNWKSRFNIPRRIPLHFVLACPFLYLESPHTESSAFRLNMLIDLDNMKYKEGKSKKHLLDFLDKIIKEAL